MTRAKQDKPQWESVLFQPVLKAYLTRHLWIIIAQISIGSLTMQLSMFSHQKLWAHDLLMKLQHQLFTSHIVLNAILGEFTNTDSIYQLYEPNIWIAIQLIWT